MARSFDVIYSYAPKAAVGRLLAFRERYPYKNMEHHGKLYRVWDVCDARRSDFAAVYLPSGMGSGEVWFPFMLSARADVRSIALSLADDEDPTVLVRAWGEMLREMGVQKCVLIGQSVGGLLAQLMANQWPELVQGLCLVTTGCPAKGLPDDEKKVWLQRRKLRRGLKWHTFDDRDRLSIASNMFESMCPEEYRDVQAFWGAFIEETFGEYVYKSQYIAVNTAMVPGIYDNYALTAQDFDAGLRVLILSSDADQTYRQGEREGLKRVFPGAQIIDIGKFGQFTMQLDEEHMGEIISKFVAEVGASV